MRDKNDKNNKNEKLIQSCLYAALFCSATSIVAGIAAEHAFDNQKDKERKEENSIDYEQQDETYFMKDAVAIDEVLKEVSQKLKLDKAILIGQECQNETYFVPDLAIVEYKNNGKRESKVICLKSDYEDLALYSFVTDSNKFYKQGKIGTIENSDGKLEFEDLGYTDIKINYDVYSCVQQYCEFGNGLNVSTDIIQKVEAGYKNPRTITSVLAENANGEWKEYYDITEVIYEVNGEKTVCLMALESNSKTQRIYRSLTCPEISLVETIDENFDIVKSEIVTNCMFPSQNEELRQTADVRKIGMHLPSYQIRFNQVLEYESSIIEEENGIKRNKSR